MGRSSSNRVITGNKEFQYVVPKRNSDTKDTPLKNCHKPYSHNPSLQSAHYHVCCIQKLLPLMPHSEIFWNFAQSIFSKPTIPSEAGMCWKLLDHWSFQRAHVMVPATFSDSDLPLLFDHIKLNKSNAALFTTLYDIPRCAVWTSTSTSIYVCFVNDNENVYDDKWMNISQDGIINFPKKRLCTSLVHCYSQTRVTFFL